MPRRKAPTSTGSVHKPVAGPCSLPRKRCLPRDEDEDGESSRSAEPKKQYRSSDARWRKNLKQAFRLLRDITVPNHCAIPIAGKNMRRDILIHTMSVIEQLEDDISLFVNIREVREQFEEMEFRNRFGDGDEDAGDQVTVPAVRKRSRTRNPVPVVPQISSSSALCPVALEQGDLSNATNSIHVVDQSDDTDLSQQQTAGFDLEEFLTSTPKLTGHASDECQVRQSKTKFAAAKRPENVRRRLNMDEADENMVLEVSGTGGGDGPVHFDQAVDEYLETSFTQLLHMSQGGTLYCEPVAHMDGPFSDGGTTTTDPPVAIAYDVEVECPAFLLEM